MNIASIKSSLGDEANQRMLLGACADIIVFVVAFSLLNAVLGLALWAWLAWLLASIAAAVGSFAAGLYVQTTGYDCAVNAVAGVRGWFARTTSKVAA